jgi:UDP-N-acetylmuramate: L-alanyl-gamma-D-glutamyl-meso-diaminopimelate ligase
VLERKIRYCSLPEAIRDHFLWGSARSSSPARTARRRRRRSRDGCSTHGGADPTVLVGGIALNFGEHGIQLPAGGGRDFVIEGDEYDSAFFDKTAKFLKYLPDVAVVGNVEFDHADIYADLDAVRLAFRRLVNLVPRRGLLLLGGGQPHAAGAAR